MKFFTVVKYIPILLSCIYSANAAEYGKIETCYDSDRAFSVCPENQGADWYRAIVADVHGRGKAALIVFGYEGCPWCDRAVTMFFTSPVFESIREKSVLVPISSRTQSRVLDGKAVFARNHSAREYLSSLGINPADNGVPQIYVINVDGSTATIIDEISSYEQNYRFHKEDLSGELKMKSDGSRPLRYKYRGFNAEKLASYLEAQIR